MRHVPQIRKLNDWWFLFFLDNSNGISYAHRFHTWKAAFQQLVRLDSQGLAFRRGVKSK